MPSKILVEQIAHTNETSALDIDSSGNMVLQKELKFGGTGAIKNSAGNAILQESGGNVTISNVRLPASGGISDSSGNSLLTESNGKVNLGSTVVPSSPAMFRNRIINGGMFIDQRNVGSATTINFIDNTEYFMDRWEGQFYNYLSNNAVSLQQISTDSPQGFSHSMKVDCTGTSALDSNLQLYIEQQIEGRNLFGIEWFNNSPSVLTLSFYVKSNLTGTFPVSIRLSDNGSTHTSSSTRSLPLRYEINSANTWERKEISFTLDSFSGTKVISNMFAMSVVFWLDAGTNKRSGTYNVWGSNDLGATGGLNNYEFTGDTNNEFYLTGVQLELGPVATPFEHRPYGTELSLCQRYYQNYKDQMSTNHQFLMKNAYYESQTFIFPVEMRGNPTVSTNGIFLRELNGSSSVSATETITARRKGFHCTSNVSNNATFYTFVIREPRADAEL